jgi:hypothetical protein
MYQIANTSDKKKQNTGCHQKQAGNPAFHPYCPSAQREYDQACDQRHIFANIRRTRRKNSEEINSRYPDPQKHKQDCDA